EVIAARAGVGIGTLYRHFPNRDALVAAAYRHEVGALCAAAADRLAGQPADQALRAWLERFADYIATKRAMGNALRSAGAADLPACDRGVTCGRLVAESRQTDVLAPARAAVQQRM